MRLPFASLTPGFTRIVGISKFAWERSFWKHFSLFRKEVGVHNRNLGKPCHIHQMCLPRGPSRWLCGPRQGLTMYSKVFFCSLLFIHLLRYVQHAYRFLGLIKVSRPCHLSRVSKALSQEPLSLLILLSHWVVAMLHGWTQYLLVALYAFNKYVLL